jgi:erythromycin esterase
MIARRILSPIVLAMWLLAGCPQEPGDDGLLGDDDSAGDDDADLPAGIYAVDGIDVDLPFYDLAPLGEMTADADVIALGETIHTSGGYYRAKERLIRYLVEEEGVRAVAIESPWVAADEVADYVGDGEGAVEVAVVNGLFTVWAGEAMADLVEWLWSWNEANPSDPVVFFGFDIQQPWHDGEGLKEFVGDALPLEAATLDERIDRCNGADYGDAYEYYSDPSATAVDEGDHVACLEVLDELALRFDDEEAALVAATSEEAMAYAWIHLVGLRSWEGEIYLYESDYVGSYAARDVGMADVFLRMWDLRAPGERVALWAHNWHIAAHTENMVASSVPATNMGGFLDDTLGDAYAPIGLLAYDISINWPGVMTGALNPPATDDNVAAMLHDLGHEYLLVDLEFPGTDEPFLIPGEPYRIGTAQSGADTLIPAEHYRGLFYLDDSPAMVGLGW